MQKGKYPSTYYRVSLKALIRNERGEVLAVKEGNDKWNLPGGGIDHGESLELALAREMEEEALIKQPFTSTQLGVDAFYTPTLDAWLMWIVCELKFEDALFYGIGPDATEVAFIDPKSLKNSDARCEQLVYKWSQKSA